MMENGANREKGEFKAQGETKASESQLETTREGREPAPIRSDRSHPVGMEVPGESGVARVQALPKKVVSWKDENQPEATAGKARRKGRKKEEKEKKVSDRATFELGIVAAATEQQQAAGLPYSIVGSEPAPNPPGLNR